MSEALVLAGAALAAEQRRRENPLEYERTSSAGQEALIRRVAEGIDTLAHAAERAGKSRGGCLLDAAFVRGIGEIKTWEGQPLRIPVLRPPVRGLIGVDSYKLGGASLMKTLRPLLGIYGRDYTEHGGAEGCPALIKVRHELARDESQWSEIAVFPYDGVLPRGMERDFVHADEPPPIRWWEAASARVGAGRSLRLYITATPLDPRLWRPIFDLFPPLGDENDNVVMDGSVRIRWALRDNKALPLKEVEALERRASKSAFRRAKLYGYPVTGVGGCPWPLDLLQELLNACVPPKRVEALSIERMASGERESAKLQIWEDPEEGGAYYVVGDPAKGIDDGRHDPDGMQVWNRRTKVLAARLSGYVGGWGLGNAMADMHYRYNEAICDPLTTGGYGEAVLQALRSRGVYHMVRDRVEIRPGEWQERVGTIETHELRGKIIGSIERAIDTGEMVCPSAEIVTCLMECIVDKGKVVAAPGSHDEDMICLGRAMLFMGQWEAPEKSKPALKRYEPVFDKLLEKSLGYKPRTQARRIKSRAASL